MSAGHWEGRPSKAGAWAMGLALAYMGWAMWAHNWVTPLDQASLAFHEAGHPAIGILSERLMVYGGSIFQLLFPLLVCHHFKKRGEALGFVFGLGWLSTALHSMGVYIADARAQALPLVGNGDRLHDWAEILGRWGLLEWDKALGSLAAGASWIALLAAAWLLRGLWPEGGPRARRRR